jgi:zinc protease
MKRKLCLTGLALIALLRHNYRGLGFLCEGLTLQTDQKPASASLPSGIDAQEAKEVKLDNGLKVLLREVHTMPVVSVGCWYRVGSKDEQIGSSGISHWVEHMNFKGTQNFTAARMASTIEKAGGYWNGYTFLDQTAYFETVVASALDDALKLEAERMDLSLIEPAAVETERSVVISELQAEENDPKNLLDRDVKAAALKIHPYRWPTEGWLQDLEALNREQLYQHYRSYYSPNNAVLVVVGDFSLPAALDLINKRFGTIPRKSDPPRRKIVEPQQEGERRIKIVREGTTPYLEIAYPAPDILNDDFYAFLILDAALNGAKDMNPWFSSSDTNAAKSSRLFRALVDKKFAVQVTSELLPTQDPYLYKLTATLTDMFQYQPAEEVVYEELEKLKNYGITGHELDKVKNQLLTRAFLDQDTTSKLMHQLGYFESIASHQFLNTLEDKVNAVTQNDLRRVAIKYFSDRTRTVGLFVPEAKRQEIEVEKLSSAKVGEGSQKEILAAGPTHPVPHAYHRGLAADSHSLETVSQTAHFQLALRPKRRVLSNGVVLVTAQNPASPTVTVVASVKAGAMRDDDQKEGIANFVGTMLDRGTKGKNVFQIGEAFEFLGAQLKIETNYLVTSLRVNGLKKDAALFIGQLAEMLKSPSFPPAEIEKARAEILADLHQEMDDPSSVAEQVLRQRIYPKGHPFHRMVKGSIGSVEKLKAADLSSFYKRYYRPDQLVITVAGDIDTEEIEGLAEKEFGSWSVSGSSEAFAIPPASVGIGEGKQIVPMRNKSQCDIVLGVTGISITSPDYLPMLILNHILGGAGSGGRLGERIREQEGLAYDVSSAFDASLSEGPLVIRAGVGPQHVERVITLMREEIEKIRSHGITADEANAAKKYLINAMPVELEGNDQIASELERIELFQLGEDYLAQFPELIASVTMDRLLDCARTRLAFDRGALVVAGPYGSGQIQAGQ